MKRTIFAVLNIWKTKSILWPISLLCKMAKCVITGYPRGLIVEPSQKCTGGCAQCSPALNPVNLSPELLKSWLASAPASPVTIHFSGKHSDPLASPNLKLLTQIATKFSSMVSISTIGLGMKPGDELLPVDRWIFSIPAATEKSWQELRGSNELSQVIENIRTVQQKSKAMTEVVFTIWKQSAQDLKTFEQLKQKENWHHTQIVFGRFDSEGNHFGRKENIALNHKDSPYSLKGNSLIRNYTPKNCPLVDYLFLDAAGTLWPCPFANEKSLGLVKPTRDSWKITKQWKKQKQQRVYPECKWCL